MQTLAFDGRMGASGDMLLAALLAAGADPAALDPVEAALDVRYEVGETDRNGIAAVTVDVVLTGGVAERDDAQQEGNGDANDGADAENHEDSDDHRGHSHEADDRHHGDQDHHEDHGHGDHNHDDHDHGDHERHHEHHDHDHTHAEGHGPSRTYDEVVGIVEGMGLSAAVTERALAIFEILGEAEAAVHGSALHETHFHEVGADDAIADVVGACLLLDDLDVERVVTTPLSTGGGTVSMSHGTYPVPTPAVVEIAERADWELQGGPVDAELLTPTGAAILAQVAEGVDRLPPLSIESSGYGAGGYSFPDHPNVLRAIVGAGQGGLDCQPISVLETNVDDVSPEVLGTLQESLAEVGARDVSIVPLGMKKSRPGHLVRVICKPEATEAVARRLAAETGTLGVRETGASHRWVADRQMATVAINLGPGIGTPDSAAGETVEVAVKVATDEDGAVVDVSAEFEDARSLAAAADLPVREVIRRAEAAAHDAIDEGRLEL